MSASWWVGPSKKPCAVCGRTWSKSGDHPGCVIRETAPKVTVHALDCAPHLRGRVTLTRKGTFYSSVVNTHTGDVVSSDGPFGLLRHAMDECVLRVLCARGAWMYGYRKADLK